MATRTPIVLFDGTYIPATNTTLFTAGTGERITITMAVAYNSDATSTESVTIHRVENGASLTAEKIIQPAKNIAAGTSAVLDKLLGVVLEPGDYISAIASTASKVSLQIFGSKHIS